MATIYWRILLYLLFCCLNTFCPLATLNHHIKTSDNIHVHKLQKYIAYSYIVTVTLSQNFKYEPSFAFLLILVKTLKNVEIRTGVAKKYLETRLY
jgi:hypothetical protein